MRTIKCLFIVAALALASAVSSMAQQYSCVTNSLFTNTLTAAQTETLSLGSTNTVTKYDWAGLQITGKSSAANVGSNIVFLIVRSCDGTNFESTNGYSWSVDASGIAGGAVCGYTNLDSSFIGSAGYFKIKSATVQHGSASLTNCVLKVTLKPSRYGN